MLYSADQWCSGGVADTEQYDLYAEHAIESLSLNSLSEGEHGCPGFHTDGSGNERREDNLFYDLEAERTTSLNGRDTADTFDPGT